MTVHLNGESRDVPENLTLTALVACLNLPADQVAVERNLEIVPRRLWDQTIIEPGDRLEVVHFVGGGCESVGQSWHKFARLAGRNGDCPPVRLEDSRCTRARPALRRSHADQESGIQRDCGSHV